MNKAILENNKKLNTINFNYGKNKSFDDYVDNVKYKNKLHNQKIEYVLSGMNFEVEKNIFKKFVIGFKLVINRILNKKRIEILKDFLFILFVQCALIASLILVLIELSVGGF